MEREIITDVLPRHWVHSYEEDSETEMVFRPATYQFPLSRGRKSFDLKPDGTLVERGIGPTDRPQLKQGKWKLEGNDNLAFYAGSESVPKRVMHIAFVDRERLIIKK